MIPIYSNKLVSMPTIVLLFCSVFLSGCGTMQAYPGEERPAHETAIVRGGGFFPFKNIYITAVDGKKIGLEETRVVVLPGEHRVDVYISITYGLYQFTQSAHGAVTFTAQQGHEYEVNGRVEGGKAKLWIEDTTSASGAGSDKSK